MAPSPASKQHPSWRRKNPRIHLGYRFCDFPQKSQFRLKIFKFLGILPNYDSLLTNCQSISSTLSSNQELTWTRTFRPEVILKSKSRRSAWVVLKIMSGKKSTISYPVQDPLPRLHPFYSNFILRLNFEKFDIFIFKP